MATPMYDFDWKTLHERRQVYKAMGWIMLVVGILSLFVDEARFPMRTTLAVGVTLCLTGLVSLYLGHRLPIIEAREYVFACSQKGRPVTASELCHQMRVSVHTAELILDTLVQKGFIRVAKAVPAAKRAPGSSASEPAYEAIV